MTQLFDIPFCRRKMFGFALAAILPSYSDTAAAEKALTLPVAFDKKEIERKADLIVKNAMTEAKVPGLLLAIVKNGKTVWRKGYGYSDREMKIIAKPEDLYDGGSDGKIFTATAIILLEKDGKLRLQDTLSRHLKSAPAKWKDITIEMLLRHRSGIQEYDGNPLFNITKEWTNAVAIQKFGEFPLDFKPGTQFNYSNTNYALLGFIIESVTGEEHSKFLRRRIFDPAHMPRARINDSAIDIPGRAIGYAADVDLFQREGKFVVNRAGKASRSVNRFGDGSILVSLDDFIAWQDAVARAIILPKAVQKKLESSPPFADNSKSIVDYGAGWYTQFVRGERLVAHSGSWLGFSSWFGIFPEEQLAIGILCNAEYWDITRTYARLSGLFNRRLGPYLPIIDTASQVTSRDKALFKSYISRGKQRSAAPQQRRYSLELFLDTSQPFDFRLTYETETDRAYLASVGEGITKSGYLVMINRRGQIEIHPSW
jgi:CubicO group peptidase (beta-lactamase class C family)